ncbi:D-glycerate dehydrogenase [Candidatus Falkowbacteria bacterium]|nr:D-glycerate dehydrogenase [Candidatus Falkowbacteria bacterium]
MSKIYITRKITDTAIKALKKAGHKVSMYPHSDRQIPRKELLKNIKGCDAVLTLLTEKVDAEFFKAAGKQLKVVANYAVGFDNIDLKAAKQYDVKIGNTPCEEVNEAVSEASMTMMLALATQIVNADAFTKAGKYKTWDPMIFTGPSLVGKTLGIIGAGRIGGGLAHRAKEGFGIKIVYNNPQRNPEFEKMYGAKFMTKEQLLKVSDFVSLHVPLLASTRHLISTKEFKLMKKTAYLINTARGPVVDEKALILALKRNQIAGAALDVYENEPALDADPSDNISLRDKDIINKLIMTPHTASATIEAREKMAQIASGNIINALKGKKMISEVV